MGESRIYLDKISVFRDAQCIWIYWLIEEGLRNLMLHHLFEYLMQQVIGVRQRNTRISSLCPGPDCQRVPHSTEAPKHTTINNLSCTSAPSALKVHSCSARVANIQTFPLICVWALCEPHPPKA